MDALPLIQISPCFKAYRSDLDKAVAPEETLARVRALFRATQMDILAKTERVDVGRLGIPVFMSRAGQDARAVLPTRKQMGKGSSPKQAECSAVMELIERFSYFSFLKQLPFTERLSWTEAKKRFSTSIISTEEMLLSVDEDIPAVDAERVLSLLPWTFYPATNLTEKAITWIPLDWFTLINEFNGSSAGNTEEESILQGLSELIERHACALIDKSRHITRTIRQADVTDPTLKRLLDAFISEDIPLILKDFSEGLPLPTIGAIAWDPKTFPATSEIVFTAGTATSPEKAAIRAVTEVAQLAGDFCTKSCYEASGLPKFMNLSDIAWLKEGEECEFSDLPCIENPDMAYEIEKALERLAPKKVYSIRTTHPDLGIPSHYTIIPGFSFRERDRNQCLGLFVGRKLIEEGSITACTEGLRTLEQVYGNAHFLPFFAGMLALREENPRRAIPHFEKAVPLQPDRDSRALSLFYEGYALTLLEDWKSATPFLEEAFDLSPSVKEYGNLLGVSLFKQKKPSEAKEVFLNVLRIDKGSAMDLANLGLCEELLGENEMALHHLREALALDPLLSFAKSHIETLSAEETKKAP
ncbi:MAG: YcaO-like family protein [Desulfovibrio sp.]|nr:YcaO-like family protein [Desulfovibrio sp.]